MAGLVRALIVTLFFTTHLVSTPQAMASNHTVLVDIDSVNLTHFQMGYFVDHSGSMSFEDVRQQVFTESTNKLSLGTRAKTTWSKILIKNLTDQPRRLFLHHPYAYHNRQVDFYEQVGDDFKPQFLNLDQADKSPLMYRGSAIFEFPLAPGETKELYVNSVSFSHQWFTLLILDENHSRRALLGLGAHNDIALMVGIFLALVIYNFLLYFSSNKKENIYYSFYLISAAVWISLSYGLLASLFDVYGAQILSLHLTLLSMAIFLLLFMMDIFQTRQHYPTEHKFLQFILLLLSIDFAYGIFDIVGALKHASSLAALMMLITLSVSISLVRKGNPLAKYFLFGHCLFVLFNGIAVLFYKGIIGFNYVSSHGVGIGIMLEALMLAFIISYRIKMLEDIKASQAELKRQAVTDPLTQLYNRRYFYTEANYLLEHARKTGAPMSLLILDIDKFKNINDTFGHPVGDAVIVALAKLLQSNSREGDLIARFGGEEFVVLLPQTETSAAEALAEQIRQAAEQCAVEQPEGEPVAFSVSIGGMHVDAQRETIETALNLADVALYEAKNSGRNRVCFSQCQPELFQKEALSSR